MLLNESDLYCKCLCSEPRSLAIWMRIKAPKQPRDYLLWHFNRKLGIFSHKCYLVITYNHVFLPFSGVFLLCWLPFFTVNIMNAICIRLEAFHHPACSIDPMLMSLFVWLGYLNSFINPIIYTIFNIEFRKAFKRIFTDVCITYK